MKSMTLNPTQLHLLKMFSYAKSDEELDEIKKALSLYFSKKVEEGMDKLWDEGLWNQEKNEAVLKEHLKPHTTNKIVLDTNCLLASLSKKGNYFKIWRGLQEGKYTLCVSNEILEEYEEIIADKTVSTQIRTQKELYIFAANIKIKNYV